MPSAFDEAIFDIRYSLPTLQLFHASGRCIPARFLLRCPNLIKISAFVYIRDHYLLNPAIQQVNFSGVTPDNFYKISPCFKYRSLGINIDADSRKDYMEHILDFSRWSRVLDYLSTHLGTCLECLSMTISSRLLSALFLQVPLLRWLQNLN